MTTKSDVVVPSTNNLALAHEAGTQVERFRAFSHALEAVDDPRCQHPIPRFMLDMPWAGDDDETQDRIIATMLSRDDPYAEPDERGTLSYRDLIGKRVVIHDIRVAPSKFKGGWGAFLVCDVTVEDSADHEILTVGAREAVSKLSLAYFRGDLPIQGTPTIITETSAGNTVLGFTVERPFD